ncbi:MAG: heparinase II/III family protein [Kiritimatiellae bacterium]|nr:heparinase II/III family protein [Kiritimatiellia bacterium]
MTVRRRLNGSLMLGLVSVSVMSTRPGACAAAAARQPFTVGRGHPRIFFTQEDLPALRKRIQTTHAQQWNGMKQWADGHRDSRRSDKERRGQVATYAFLYRLSGEPAYAEKAISMAKELLTVDFADAPRGGRPANRKEDTQHIDNRASRAGAVAFAYDWCHDRLTPGDKTALLKGLDELGGLVYEALSTRGGYPDFNNHRAHHVTYFGIASLAMHGDHPNGAKYLGCALSAYRQGIIPAMQYMSGPGDGMWHEGLEYQRHQLLPAFLFCAACRGALGEDLFAPEFEQFAYGTLYGTYPDTTLLRGNDVKYPQADTTWERKYMSMIASRYRNPHAQWFVQHVADKPITGSAAWYDILWHDPAVPETPPDDMPLARAFEGYGMAVLRTGWYEPDATVVTFRCGDFFGGHDHYDQNSFTIYRKGHLAIDSGGYDRWYSTHWLNYYSRTVAHNTVTIFDPAEDHTGNFGKAANDGGQICLRFRKGAGETEPQTIAQFLRSPEYDTGDIVVLEQAPGYARVLGDATRAYSPHKLKSLTRELVLLHPTIKTNPPTVVVFDRVEATRADYAKKWLLHTAEKPEQVGPGTWRATQGDGTLYVRMLEPRGARVTLVGGPGREFEVNGTNYPLPEKDAANRPPNVPGNWRLELEPPAPAERDVFLNVLRPVDKDQASVPAVTRLEAANMLGSFIKGERGEPDTLVWFARDKAALGADESVSYRIEQGGEVRHLINDLPANVDYAIRLDGTIVQTQRTQDTRTQTGEKKDLEPSCSLSFTTPAGARGTIAIAPVRLSPRTAARSAAVREDAADWQPVFEEEFSDESYRERWHLDGTAELAIEREGNASALKIATRAGGADAGQRASVLWCKRRLAGDVRICLRARGESGNRGILLFNARPMPDSGHATIFDWVRPDSAYARYAGDPIWAMYSVGILRNDEKACNLRYIGGTAAAALAEVSYKRFQEETVIAACDSPFRGKPLTWFELDLRVIGKRIVLFVDGAKAIDLVDPGNMGTPEYGWTALTGGGWFGIRNFVPKCVWVDRVRVYGMAQKSTVEGRMK